MLKYSHQKGFTLVELSTSMTIAIILMLTFTAILYIAQRQTDSLKQRLTLFRDVMILDKWVHHYVQSSILDSVAIYSNVTDELNGTTSNDGSILHLFLPDSTRIRLALSGQQVNWQVNLEDNQPLDSPASRVRIRRGGGHLLALNLEITLYNNEDSLDYDRFIVPRN